MLENNIVSIWDVLAGPFTGRELGSSVLPFHSLHTAGSPDRIPLQVVTKYLVDPFLIGHPYFPMLLLDPRISQHTLQRLLHFTLKFPWHLEASRDLTASLDMAVRRKGRKLQLSAPGWWGGCCLALNLRYTTPPPPSAKTRSCVCFECGFMK